MAKSNKADDEVRNLIGVLTKRLEKIEGLGKAAEQSVTLLKVSGQKLNEALQCADEFYKEAEASM